MNRKLFKTKTLSIITAVALFVGVGLIYGFTSTNKVADVKEKKETKAPTTYYYNYSSSAFADMQISGNWQTAQNDDYTCAGNAAIPCSVTVPDGVTISSYLSGFTTLSALLTAANDRRQVQ